MSDVRNGFGENMLKANMGDEFHITIIGVKRKKW